MEQDILDIILDENNKENIVFEDADGKKLTFEQVAVIPYGENEDKKIYVILHPLDKIEGINDGEAIAFRVDEYGDGHVLVLEESFETSSAVFRLYYQQLEKSGIDISNLIN